MKTYFVYIMANGARTTYIGMTNNLERRVWEHRTGEVEGFASAHGMTKLVHIEDFDDVRQAIAREKQLKNWRRAKKLALVNSQNPDWDDLAKDWYG